MRQILTDEGSKCVVPRKDMPFGGLNDIALNLGPDPKNWGRD